MGNSANYYVLRLSISRGIINRFLFQLTLLFVPPNLDSELLPCIESTLFLLQGWSFISSQSVGSTIMSIDDSAVLDSSSSSKGIVPLLLRESSPSTVLSSLFFFLDEFSHFFWLLDLMDFLLGSKRPNTCNDSAT